MNEDLRYPVGRHQDEGPLSEPRRLELIEQIAEAPERLRAAVHGLNPEQLDTPYRHGGWTVRQVIHHVPDSHLNAYVRFKLALTEDTPTEISLTLLDALHKRWVILLRAMDSAGWARTLQHPEMGRLTLDQMLALYAWHGRHHVAHVTSLREREGWG
jgi:hypothetical protein